ncbi:HEAT repeat domain-containing protein [Haloglomus salinum]|jgi:HEAT repeat protein|uniref:HEAT repeat domain-containing protein n=1 Tax=Haloglomus salinum TaxID=2962673 RepID=UPI0020C93D70|nr:HEAT repeat domain-containing protein [Haloglomus salinum]
MLVFAFDRDWTVDVNAHPRREAVPLEWVRELAHGTEHAVYAIGNQDLAAEAAIPGVVDIVGMHPDDWDRWLGEKRRDGRYERFPKRRERLGLIADLHPEADGYVVVDDIDLSDVDGWDHYHAWEFVPAVERGEIDPALPWVRDRVGDGGVRSAGTTPVDAAHLDAWLDEHADAPGFELAYTEDGTERSVLCRNLSLDQRTLDRPAAAPVLRCHPAAPDRERFDVLVRDIEAVHVVDPPTEAYLPATDDPVEQATAFADLAADNPFAVDVSRVLALLDREDETPQAAALAALRHTAAARPAECTPALPILRSLLEGGCAEPGHALSAVASIGEADAADIAPLSDAVTEYLTGTDDAVRKQAASCIVPIAEADPDDVVDAVPSLATLLEDRVATHHAAHALSLLAAESPWAVEPAAPALGEVLADESLSPGARLSATAALGRVANENPTVALGLVDEVAALLESEHPKLRNNATGLLWEVSRLHADHIEPHVDTVAGLLSAEDDFTRVNGSAAMARVAEDLPDRAREHLDRLRPLLADEHRLVRVNACWALGHLEDEASLEALRDLAVEDDDEQVRKRAQWAVAEIAGGPV